MTDTGLSLFHEGYRIGGTTRPERFKAMDIYCRQPERQSRLLEEWFAHPTYDEYWADEDCTRHLRRDGRPLLHDRELVRLHVRRLGRKLHRPATPRRPELAGKAAAPDRSLAPRSFKETNEDRRTRHSPENARFTMEAHMVRWFDHYLKGSTTASSGTPAVRYYVMGAVGEPDAPGNLWRTAADWPVPAATEPYYLRAGGGLHRADTRRGE